MTRLQLVSISCQRLCTLKIEQSGCSSGEIIVIDFLYPYSTTKNLFIFLFSIPFHDDKEFKGVVSLVLIC